MTGQKEESRGPNSGAMAALRDGMGRVNRAPVVVACVFVATLLTALPLSLVMREALQAHLGNSLMAEQAAQGVHVQWWREFTEQAGVLGKTFTPGIIGFAAVLDNLSAFADGEARPSPVVWLGAGYLLLWLFLAGGVLDRYARARPTRSYEFFSACGVYFVRFLRLTPFIAASYYFLFAVVHPLLIDRLFAELTRDLTVERTAFFVRVALYAIFGLLLVFVSVVFDYAKVRAVVEDRRSMIGAIAAGARFARRNAAAVATLYLLTAGLFAALLVVYAIASPGAASSGAGVWLGLAIGQLYVLGRLWIRLLFFASETALFQGRLAHAGYMASAPVARPEPAIVENVL